MNVERKKKEATITFEKAGSYGFFVDFFQRFEWIFNYSPLPGM